MIRQDGFYLSFVLLIEGDSHVVAQNQGYLIGAFLHVEKAEAMEP